MILWHSWPQDFLHPHWFHGASKQFLRRRQAPQKCNRRPQKAGPTISWSKPRYGPHQKIRNLERGKNNLQSNMVSLIYTFIYLCLCVKLEAKWNTSSSAFPSSLSHYWGHTAPGNNPWTCWAGFGGRTARRARNCQGERVFRVGKASEWAYAILNQCPLSSSSEILSRQSNLWFEPKVIKGVANVLQLRAATPIYCYRSYRWYAKWVEVVNHLKADLQHSFPFFALTSHTPVIDLRGVHPDRLNLCIDFGLQASLGRVFLLHGPKAVLMRINCLLEVKQSHGPCFQKNTHVLQ